jgi:molybdopterin converting factor small subunit
MFGDGLLPVAPLRTHMATNEPTAVERGAGTEATTTVDVRCTGHVRTEIGEPRMEFTFEGETLRAFLEAFFEEYDVADLLIAETEAEATAHGWAPTDGDPPGTWNKNPEGEQTRAFARVAVNGRFNEHLDGLDTELEDGDRVALMYPFIFCC